MKAHEGLQHHGPTLLSAFAGSTVSSSQVVLSKKMSHPNVVQCYSWTVLMGGWVGAAHAIPSKSGQMNK